MKNTQGRRLREKIMDMFSIEYVQANNEDEDKQINYTLAIKELSQSDSGSSTVGFKVEFGQPLEVSIGSQYDKFNIRVDD